MRRSPVKQAEDHGQQIDLTPMLDVVFIMLIFFIVTASFIKTPGIQVRKPEAETWDQIRNQNIIVAISPTNAIWINKQVVKPESVRSVIERMHAENPKGALVIEVDDDSNAKTFATVYDAAKKAGVTDIAVATAKE